MGNRDYKTHDFSWYDELSERESIELGYMSENYGIVVLPPSKKTTEYGLTTGE
jgi:hypothetical protein